MIGGAALFGMLAVFTAYRAIAQAQGQGRGRA